MAHVFICEIPLSLKGQKSLDLEQSSGSGDGLCFLDIKLLIKYNIFKCPGLGVMSCASPMQAIHSSMSL